MQGKRRRCDHDRREHRHREHYRPAPPIAGIRTAQDIAPIGLPDDCRKKALELRRVEVGHVRASLSRVRSVAWAALRVAATVPVEIPSASAIAA